MGYYTDYDISKNSEEIQEAILEHSGYSELWGVKWYDCRKHMADVSLLFPDTTLHVKGDGEENGDIWQAWYLNGKECYQKAVIMLPETPTEFK